MIMIPMSINTSGGGSLSNKAAISMWIVINFLCLISFCVLYYLFSKENYNSTFWDWTWDNNFRLSQYKCCDWKIIDTYAGLGVIFLWIPLFLINGIALIVLLVSIVERLINKYFQHVRKISNNRQAGILEKQKLNKLFISSTMNVKPLFWQTHCQAQYGKL